MATPASEALDAARKALAQRDLPAARRIVESCRDLDASADLLHIGGCVAIDQRRYADARDLLQRAQLRDPQSALIAFNLGLAYFALNDYAACLQPLRSALVLEARRAQAAFSLGYALGRLGDWQHAAQALLLAVRSGDTRGETMQGIAESARTLVAAAQRAPEIPLPPARATGKISFVVCSISSSKLDKLRTNLDQLLVAEDWELIHIADAKSLCEGYTRGAAQARGELLVFCHDDIRIISPDFANKLRAHLAVFDLIGVAGTTKASGPSWGWSGPPHMFCRVSQPWITKELERYGPATLVIGAKSPVIAGAQLLDGVFMAARRGLVDSIGFDAQTFDRFHFYDLDFSFRAHLAGAKVAICLDIVLFHDSAGNYNADYWRYAQSFCAKFPQACTAAQHSKAEIPWISLATDDNQLLAEQQWLDHWLSRDDATLLAEVSKVSVSPSQDRQGYWT